MTPSGDSAARSDRCRKEKARLAGGLILVSSLGVRLPPPAAPKAEADGEAWSTIIVGIARIVRVVTAVIPVRIVTAVIVRPHVAADDHHAAPMVSPKNGAKVGGARLVRANSVGSLGRGGRA